MKSMRIFLQAMRSLANNLTCSVIAEVRHGSLSPAWMRYSETGIGWPTSLPWPPTSWPETQGGSSSSPSSTDRPDPGMDTQHWHLTVWEPWHLTALLGQGKYYWVVKNLNKLGFFFHLPSLLSDTWIWFHLSPKYLLIIYCQININTHTHTHFRE